MLDTLIAFVLITAILTIPSLVYFYMRRQMVGKRFFQYLYYRAKGKFLHYPPHLLAPSLLYWEKGDEIKEIAGEWNSRWDEWRNVSYRFEGFLENTIVVSKDSKTLEELTAASFVSFTN